MDTNVPDYVYDINNLLKLDKIFSTLMYNKIHNNNIKIETLDESEEEVISIGVSIWKENVKEIHLIKMNKQFIPNTILENMKKEISSTNLTDRFKIASYTACIGKMILVINILALINYYNENHNSNLFKTYFDLLVKFSSSAMGLSNKITTQIFNNSNTTMIYIDMDAISKYTNSEYLKTINEFSIENYYFLGMKLLFIGTIGSVILNKDEKKKNIFNLENLNDLQKILYGYMNLEDKVKYPIGVDSEKIKNYTFKYMESYLNEKSESNCNKLFFIIEYILSVNIKLKKIGINNDKSFIIKLCNELIRYREILKEKLGINKSKCIQMPDRLISEVPIDSNPLTKLSKFSRTHTDSEFSINNNNFYVNSILENIRSLDIIEDPLKEGYFENYNIHKEMLDNHLNRFINLLFNSKKSSLEINFNSLHMYEFLMDLVIWSKYNDKEKENEFLLGSIIEYNYSVFNNNHKIKSIKNVTEEYSKTTDVKTMLLHFESILRIINRKGFYWLFSNKFTNVDVSDLFINKPLSSKFITKGNSDEEFKKIIYLLNLKGSYVIDNKQNLIKKSNLFNANTEIDADIKDKILSNQFNIEDLSKLSNDQARCVGAFFTALINNKEITFDEYYDSLKE